MAEITWKPAQKAAIFDRGGTLLVSAAAGSGKTEVLAERALQLILEGADADRLLILTFTRAAAAEMRARIAKKLEKACREHPDDHRLARQRILLQRASIGTMDSFCQELLRRHLGSTDIPPDFEIADDTRSEAMWQQVIAETMEACLRDPDFCAFADVYGRGRTDAAAEQAVRTVYNYLQVMPYPLQALDDMLSDWRKPDGFCETGWHAVLCETIRRKAAENADALARALQLLSEDTREAVEAEKTPAKRAKAEAKFAVWKDTFEAVQDILRRMAELAADTDPAAQNANWDELYAFAEAFGDKTADPWLPLYRKSFKSTNYSAIKEIKDAAKKACAKLAESLPADTAGLEKDRAAVQPMLEGLARAVRDVSDRLYALKLQEKQFGFNDIAHAALQLMLTPDGKRTPLCEEIAAGYAAVMVDEYQDTNALQDALYGCLARADGSNLFFVGDIKQSIYRFRQAEPQSFAAREKAYPLLADNTPRPAGSTPARVALDANFRSAPRVIDGINYFFEMLMDETVGGVAYGDGQRLVRGAAPDGYDGTVEVDLLQADDTEKEALWVARRIGEMLRQGTPVRVKEGGTRPVAAEDICILLSRRKNFPLFAEALEKAGIRAAADIAEDLLKSPAVLPLLSLLRAIDNPAQDIYLASAMRSALFGFTEDDLVCLRAAGGGRKRTLYGSVLAAAESTEPVAPKCAAFAQRLGALRDYARRAPVSLLLEEIFVSTGYLAAVGAGKNGADRQQSVRSFAAWAESRSAKGLNQLLRLIDAAESTDKGIVEQSELRPAPGCVTITTIHRSKGLEYPVVILPELDVGMNSRDEAENILCHRTLGLGMLLRTPAGNCDTAASIAIRARIHEESLSERMRLMYVAMTRARDILVLSLRVADADKWEKTLGKEGLPLVTGQWDSVRREASSFSDWLLPAVLCHPDAAALRAPSGVKGTELLGAILPAETNSVLQVNVIDEEALAPQAQEAEEPQPLTPDPASVRRILDGFAQTYPYEAETRLPAKISVTALVHGNDAATLERPGFLYKEGMTAAEKGTALHAFLEHADFEAFRGLAVQGRAAVAAAVEKERARQLRESLMTEEDNAALDADSVCAFFAGEAFARICAADSIRREYPFITELPASVLPGNTGAAADSLVEVQGIADIVLFFADHIELLDYKTDRNKTPQQLREAYARQLDIYAEAMNRQFAPLRVTRRALYSLALGELVDV